MRIVHVEKGTVSLLVNTDAILLTVAQILPQLVTNWAEIDRNFANISRNFFNRHFFNRLQEKDHKFVHLISNKLQ